MYLIEILHQTTTGGRRVYPRGGCILSKFYIKPQQAKGEFTCVIVVSYRNSTSNHNHGFGIVVVLRVVSYRNSTSNHNLVTIATFTPLYLIEILHQTTTLARSTISLTGLYLIEILHQTTTVDRDVLRRLPLYLIEILHQTTTHGVMVNATAKLYLIEILHQTTTWPSLARSRRRLYLIEILHQTTTKHRSTYFILQLYLIEILHQTTTQAALRLLLVGCILSKFYIKPQRCTGRWPPATVVSYRNSTSNHNVGPHID